MSDRNDGTQVGKPVVVRPQDREFLGHPVGLWVLFTTEMWERFCYYGMRAFLVLYLTSTLTGTNPGFGWTEKGAYSLYGWFTGLVYFFPLFGGLIADRVIGQHRSVLLGGVLLAIGELSLWATEIFRCHAQATITLASSPGAFITFFLGLVLTTVGAGFFKPCISVMVGQLYGPNDPRRDAAFTYFYMGINVGAFLAPFVAGTVAEKYGWHWGFLIASTGMLFGLGTYMFFRPKYLGHIGMVIRGKDGTQKQAEPAESSAAATKPDAPLTRKEIDRIAVIIVLSLFSIAFWSVFEQAGSSLTTFAKRETNRQVPNWVGRNFSGLFIPNEDETDAVLSFEETRQNILGASEALDSLKEKNQEARNLLMDEGKPLHEFMKAADAYSQAAQRTSETKSVAQKAIDKASFARKAAGMEPLGLKMPTMKELLDEAVKDRARIAKKAEEQGCDTNEIVRQETAAAEKERQSAHDPAKTIYTFPSTWYQSVNSFWIILLGPVFALLWNYLGKRGLEPSTPVKFGIGLLVLSTAFLFMVKGGLDSADTAGNAGASWLFATYLFFTLGELCLSPVGLSMVTRLSPPKYASFLMGMWFLSSAVAGYLSGTLAALQGSGGEEGGLSFFFKRGMADYFLAMAFIPLVAAIVMFCIAPILRRMMHEDA